MSDIQVLLLEYKTFYIANQALTFPPALLPSSSRSPPFAQASYWQFAPGSPCASSWKWPRSYVAEQNLSAAASNVLVFLIQAAEAIVLVVVAAGDAQTAALVVTVASKAA